MMLSFTPLKRREVFLARIVMPFSRSRSIESITLVATSCPTRNAPDCHSIASTSVVLPWSTWAAIATLRMSSRSFSTCRARLARHAGGSETCLQPEAGERRRIALGGGDRLLQGGGETPQLGLLDGQRRQGLDHVHAMAGHLAEDAVLVEQRGDHQLREQARLARLHPLPQAPCGRPRRRPELDRPHQ